MAKPTTQEKNARFMSKTLRAAAEDRAFWQRALAEAVLEVARRDGEIGVATVLTELRARAERGVALPIGGGETFPISASVSEVTIRNLAEAADQGANARNGSSLKE